MQISTSDFALTQACCEPVLQSSTDQWGIHFALSKAAVYWFWVTALLYEQQIFIGLIAGTQDVHQPVLQSSSDKWGMHSALSSTAEHWC